MRTIAIRPPDGWEWVTDTLDDPSEALKSIYRAVALNLRHAKSTAFHESCHAVAHVIKGSELRGVDIKPLQLAGEIALGSTLANPGKITGAQGLVTSLAGMFASILVEPEANLSDGPRNDIRHATFYAVRGWGKPDGVTTNGSVLALELQHGEVWDLLQGHWHQTCDLLGSSRAFQQVRAVANALLAHVCLNAEQVRALAHGALELPTSATASLQEALPVVRALGAKQLTAEQFEANEARPNHRPLLKSNWTRLSPLSYPQGTLGD